MVTDIGEINNLISQYRETMDDCWTELETANTWEHINEISKCLSVAGLEYKRLRRHRDDLLSDKRRPRAGLRAVND